MRSAFSNQELIDENSVISLADLLCEAYRKELQEQGLLDEAAKGSPITQIHGGPSFEETHQHFAHRFANSASRVVCISVDAQNVFAPIPAHLLQSFSSHKITVLDAPCGAGASLLSLLTVLAVARRQRAIPSLPLHVAVIAADISPSALKLYASMVERIRPGLRECGIFLELTTSIWNAERSNETSSLCDTLFRVHHDANEFFVLIGNLSGVGAGLFDKMERSFEHITERIANFPSTILWIEPVLETTLFQKLGRLFSIAGWLTNIGTQSIMQCRFTWVEPVRSRQLKGSVTVRVYKRGEA